MRRVPGWRRRPRDLDRWRQTGRQTHADYRTPSTAARRPVPRCRREFLVDRPWPRPYMRVRLSTAFWHVVLSYPGVAWRHSSWGRGGAVSQQRLHHLACGRGAQPRARMPHARGVVPVRRDLPETRWLLATNEEDGRSPYRRGGYVACGNPFTLHHC